MVGDKPLNDECDIYVGQERRKHCEMVVALKSEYDEDKRNRDQWKEDVNEKLERIIRFLDKMEGPYNAGLWALRICVGAVITGIIAIIWKIFGQHIK
jgi:hypothetical protein